MESGASVDDALFEELFAKRVTLGAIKSDHTLKFYELMDTSDSSHYVFKVRERMKTMGADESLQPHCLVRVFFLRT